MKEDKKTRNKINTEKRKLIIKLAVISLCIIVILVLLILLLKPNREVDLEDGTKTQEAIQENREEKITDYVRTRGEKERMQVYLSEFLKHIEKGEYKEAYSRLYTKFKRNYFPTLETFTEYAKKYYSSFMSVTHEDIQRQGKYYILTVKIKDLAITQYEIEQMYVIYEKGLNDYYISFQVKY
ncbi:MAG: hypothetical protein IKP28_02325 [Clostridia bacterium]|nr:hypothetical protein [Clostridia bacterium]